MTPKPDLNRQSRILFHAIIYLMCAYQTAGDPRLHADHFEAIDILANLFKPLRVPHPRCRRCEEITETVQKLFAHREAKRSRRK